MKVIVNGQIKQVPNSCNIAKLIEQMILSHDGFAVAVNKQFVSKADYKITQLKDKDQIDIVEAMQGG